MRQGDLRPTRNMVASGVPVRLRITFATTGRSNELDAHDNRVDGRDVYLRHAPVKDSEANRLEPFAPKIKVFPGRR